MPLYSAPSCLILARKELRVVYNRCAKDNITHLWLQLVSACCYLPNLLMLPFAYRYYDKIVTLLLYCKRKLLLVFLNWHTTIKVNCNLSQSFPLCSEKLCTTIGLSFFPSCTTFLRLTARSRNRATCKLLQFKLRCWFLKSYGLFLVLKTAIKKRNRRAISLKWVIATTLGFVQEKLHIISWRKQSRWYNRSRCYG